MGNENSAEAPPPDDMAGIGVPPEQQLGPKEPSFTQNRSEEPQISSIEMIESPHSQTDALNDYFGVDEVDDDLGGYRDDTSRQSSPKNNKVQTRQPQALPAHVTRFESNRSVGLPSQRNITRSASSLDNSIFQSKFATWSREQLVLMLVQKGYELRGESNIPTSSLREFCDDNFLGQEMPSKPTPWTPDERQKLDKAVLTLQNQWVEREALRRRLLQMLEEEGGDGRSVEEEWHRGRAMTGVSTTEGDEGVDYSEEMFSMGFNVDDLMTPDPSSSLTQTPQGDLESGSAHTHKHKVNKATDFLDVPWKPPSWEKAIKYLNYVQLRRGGRGGEKFDFWQTTTGRYCCLGLLGEQCDFFREGKISELSQFGPGITNYFKFLKWLVWLFFVLSLLGIPSVVLNMYGPYMQNMGVYQLASTTVGNLELAYQNSTFAVLIPLCTNYGGYNINCYMSKDTLGLFYSWLDVLATAAIFLAFLWIRPFELMERRLLNKNTLFASKYTLLVSNLPPDCREEDLVRVFHLVLKNFPIASVHIGYDNETEILKCKHRGELVTEKKKKINEHRFQCTELKEKYSTGDRTVYHTKLLDLRKTLVKDIQDIDQKIKEVQNELQRLGEMDKVPVVAFVTFNNDGAVKKALKFFHSISPFAWYFHNHALRINGYRLHLEQASEPSTIIWENIKYGVWNRFFRRCVTTFLTFLLILFSLAITLGAKYLQITNQKQGGNQICPADFQLLSQSQQQAQIEAQPSLLHCYCDQLSVSEQQNDYLCRTYLQKTITSEILTYFASFVVLVVNFLMDFSMRFLTYFEKHHSEDTKGRSVFLRLFALKYINTGLMFLIQNNASVVHSLLGLQIADTSEFSAVWFSTIGVSIMLVQIGDILFAHSDRLYGLFMHWLKLYLARRYPSMALTQEDLNKRHEGERFEISYSYAQLMSTVFVCLTFSTGMPLLYLIAGLNFLLYYFVEKWMFLSFYLTPPRFDTSIGRRASSLIPFAIVIHLGMSIWILSNEHFFGNNATQNSTYLINKTEQTTHWGVTLIRQKIDGNITFPLFLILLIVLLYRVLSIISQKISFLKNYCGRLAESDESGVITYTRAIKRNLIKGLATYNILMNPKYKEMFRITWRFASTHKNVSSIRFDRSLQPQDGAEDEDDLVKVVAEQRHGNIDLRLEALEAMGNTIDAEKFSQYAENTMNKKGKGANNAKKRQSLFGSGKTPDNEAAYLRRQQLMLKQGSMVLGDEEEDDEGDEGEGEGGGAMSEHPDTEKDHLRAQRESEQVEAERQRQRQMEDQDLERALAASLHDQ